MKILIADDETTIRSLLFRVFKRAGHEVDIVKDGVELVAYWKQGRHSIVVSDIDMPRKNGIEACQEIQKISPETRFILITGSKELSEKAEQAGFAPCLRKPFTVKEALSVLLDGKH